MAPEGKMPGRQKRKGGMLYQEIIRRKRDGLELSAAEIRHLVAGITDETLGEGQLAAFAMAVLLRGMTLDERITLTLAMRDSGAVLQWPEIDRPVVDKHSTGGIGDNVSLMLAPALAACGAAVPMISGRGLGHTGGTLDKLDAIPGYKTQPTELLLRATVRDIGCAIIGQTAEIAPADKRFYAVRDVTATIESLDLITASILSKKLAAGVDALVLDVKCGSGAFMASEADAMALARALVDVANGAGCTTAARITDMNEPLASAAGNALEVQNSVDFLTGAACDPRLWQVVCGLGGTLLALSGLATSPESGAIQIGAALRSGAAAEVFGRMVAALGGPVDFVERPAAHLPKAPVFRPVFSPCDGFLVAYDARALGISVIELGGGRRKVADRINPAVGLSAIAPIGTAVAKGMPIAMIHAANDADFDAAAASVSAACTFGSVAPSLCPVFIAEVAPKRI
jgi:thymidine phosphorylase